MGRETELVFVEGHSKDDTYAAIERELAAHPTTPSLLLRQPGIGKADAVRLGFERASGDILMILDADLTVPPEDCPVFTKRWSRAKASSSTACGWSIPWKNRPCAA
jgi:glycosyltransferase involved in cell wall biosynthesis